MRLKVFRSLDVLYAALTVVWALGLTFYVLKLALSPEFFDQVQAHGQAFIDFVKYYVLGKIIWAGQASAIYNPGAQLDYYNSLIDPGYVQSVSYSQYPPYFMLMVAWMPLLPLNFAYLAWNFGTLLLSIIGLHFVWKQTGKLSAVTFVVIVLSMIASLSGFRTMCLGQTSWLYLAICALWCWSILQKNQPLEGVSLALSTVKFQYTPFLLIPALLGCRKKTFVAFVFVECVMLVVSGVVLGWPNILGYPEALHLAESDATTSGVFAQEMVNLRGLLSNLLPATQAFYISAGVMLVVLASIYLKARNVTRTDIQDSGLVSLIILFALCFSPHTHLYDWVLLALPAVLLLKPADLPSIMQGESTQKVWLLLLRFYPIFSWFVFLLPVGPIVVKTIILFGYGLILLFGLWRTQCLLIK